MDTVDRFSYARFIDHVKAQTALILRIDQQTFGPYDLARDVELYLSSPSPEELKAAGQDYDDLIDAVAIKKLLSELE